VEDQTWCTTTDEEILNFKRGIFQWFKDNQNQHQIEAEAKPILEDPNQQICKRNRDRSLRWEPTGIQVLPCNV